MIELLIIIPIIFIILILVDTIIINQWESKIKKNIDDIFDSIKMFLVVNVIDRIANAFNDDNVDEDENNEDTSEQI